MKLARTIRLDISDSQIFPTPAEAGEWAITGTFAFVDTEPASLTGKQAVAFKSGWLGLTSFGRATLVQIAPITTAEREAVTRQLAAHLFSEYGAPDMLAALEAAAREISDMASLCNHPQGTLLAIGREAQAEGIAEQVRKIPPPEDDAHARIWQIEDDGS